MKILNRVGQKNVVLNRDYYTKPQIREMLMKKEVCYFTKELNESYDFNDWDFEDLRVFLEKGNELKVVAFNDAYTTVLVKNGKQYFVSLD